jgi:hypothetical protein
MPQSRLDGKYNCKKQETTKIVCHAKGKSLKKLESLLGQCTDKYPCVKVTLNGKKMKNREEKNYVD